MTDAMTPRLVRAPSTLKMWFFAAACLLAGLAMIVFGVLPFGGLRKEASRFRRLRRFGRAVPGVVENTRYDAFERRYYIRYTFVPSDLGGEYAPRSDPSNPLAQAVERMANTVRAWAEVTEEEYGRYQTGKEVLVTVIPPPNADHTIGVVDRELISHRLGMYSEAEFNAVLLCVIGLGLVVMSGWLVRTILRTRRDFRRMRELMQQLPAEPAALSGMEANDA